MAVFNRIVKSGGSDGKGGGEGNANDDLGKQGADAAKKVGRGILRFIPKKVRVILIAIIAIVAIVALLILTVALMIKDTVGGITSAVQSAFSTDYDVKKETVENDTTLKNSNSDTERVYQFENDLDPDKAARMVTGISEALSGNNGQAMIDFAPVTQDDQLYISPEDLYTASDDTKGILEVCQEYNRKMFAESKVSYSYHFWNWEWFPGDPDDPDDPGYWAWVEYRSVGPRAISDYGQDSPSADSFYGDETSESVEGEEKEWLCWHNEASNLSGRYDLLGYASREKKDGDTCPHCGASGMYSSTASQLFVQEMGANTDLPSYVKGYTCPNCHNPYYVFTEKRFALHWQEIVAAVELAGYGNYENWDNSEEADGGFGGSYDRLGSENSVTKNYYLKEDQIKEFTDYFKYETKYKYNAMTDSRKYDFNALEKSSNSVGYHFFKEDVEPSIQDSEDRHNPFYTYYIPESCPLSIKNGYESISYVYQHYDADEMRSYYCDEGFMESRDSYNVQGGDVILGRFDAIEPYSFVTLLDKYCPYYWDSADKGTQTASNGGSWAQNLVGHYCETLSDIDAKLPGRREQNRSEFFMQLARDYDAKVIRIRYDGTKCEETEKELEKVEKAYTDKDEYKDYKFLYAKFPEADMCNDADWTEDRDEFLNGLTTSYYSVTTSLSSVPFHSYGVVHTGKSDNGGGSSSHSGQATFSRSIYLVTAHVSGETHYYPDVQRDNVFIDPETGERYGIVPIDDGALEPLLDHSDNMTIDQVRLMCQYLYDKFDRPDLPFNSDATVQALYDWQESTGQPITGALALILTEGTYNKGSASSVNEADHWNFWNYEPYGSEPWYTNPGSSRHWLDVKTLVHGDFPQALIHIMNKFYHNVWLGETRGGIGQPTYYEMSFRGYDLTEVQTLEGAKAHADDFNYCFCPWWGSPAFMQTGDEQYIYPNMNARDRRILLEAAGIKTVNSIGQKLEACANWYLRHIPLYGDVSYSYLDTDDNPFGQVYTYGSQKVRADCTGFAAAFASSLVPDVEVHTTDSESSARTDTSFAEALIAAGYSLHRIDEYENGANFPIGSFLVQKKSDDPRYSGHVEIVVGNNGDGTLSTFGWGGKQSEYPSGTLSIYKVGDELKTDYNHYRYVWLY